MTVHKVNSDSEILELFGKNETFAKMSKGRYTVFVTDIPEKYVQRGTYPCGCESRSRYGIIYFKRDNLVTWCGFWMDWTEPEWGATEEQYYALPKKTRAKLEAKEQLDNWIEREFDSLVNSRGAIEI